MYATKKLDDTYEKQVTIKEMEIKGGYLVNNTIFERHLAKLFKKWIYTLTRARAHTHRGTSDFAKNRLWLHDCHQCHLVATLL